MGFGRQQFEAVELIFEAAYCIAVCLHLWIVTARLLHYLVDDELRVTAHVETFDAELDGDAAATEEGLVVGCWEVKTNHVAHVLSEG